MFNLEYLLLNLVSKSSIVIVLLFLSSSNCCVPCGHAYCYDCINKTSNCYICRGIIQNKIKLYLF